MTIVTNVVWKNPPPLIATISSLSFTDVNVSSYVSGTVKGVKLELYCDDWDEFNEAYCRVRKKGETYDRRSTRFSYYNHSEFIDVAIDTNNKFQAAMSTLSTAVKVYLTAYYKEEEMATKEEIREEMDDNSTKLAFLAAIEGGRWKIISNQMIFYKSDNVTEVARFNLLDKDGSPTEKNVMERARV